MFENDVGLAGDCPAGNIDRVYGMEKIKRFSDNMMKTGVVRFPDNMTKFMLSVPPCGMNMKEKQPRFEKNIFSVDRLFYE